MTITLPNPTKQAAILARTWPAYGDPYPTAPYPLEPLNVPMEVMADPPTITVGSANGATVISGGVTKAPGHAAFTYTGCRAGPGLSFPNDGYYSPANITATDGSKTLYVSSPFAVEFEYEGQQFELHLKGVGSSARYRLTVDGEGYVTRSGQAGPTSDGNRYRVLFDFGTAANRRIRFDFAGNAFFGGITHEPTRLLTQTTRAQGPKVIIIGDSFTEGSNADSPVSSFYDMLRFHMGWLDVTASGWGGTGYLNDSGGTRTKFRTRAQKDVIDAAPDIVIVCGGLNDHLLYSASAIETEADLLFDMIRDALPDVTLIVADPWWPRGTGVATIQQAIDAIRAGAAPYEDAHIRTMGGPRPYSGDTSDYVNKGWWTGTGYVGNEQGDGNSDRYTSSDGTHPTQAGHDMIGRRMAEIVAGKAAETLVETVFDPPVPWTPSTFLEAIDYTPGLVAHWRLDEPSGGSADNREGTSANDGAITNVTYSQTGALTGDANTCMGFNGTSARVRAASITTLDNTAYTMMCWFYNSRATGSANTLGHIMARGAGAASDALDIAGTISSSTHQGQVFATNESANVYGTTVTVVNTWYFVALTRNGTAIKVYLGDNAGNFTTEINTTLTVTYTVDTTTVGGRSDSQLWFSGRIDEPAIYNGELTATQIQAIYNAGRGVFA